MTKLIEHIKNNPDAIYGKGCTEENVNAAENSLGATFAEEYREYLLNFSVLAFDGREFTGITKAKRLNVVDVTKQQRELNSGVADDWYVVEEANFDGIVAWQDQKGLIYETVPGKVAKKVADSFLAYIGL